MVEDRERGDEIEAVVVEGKVVSPRLSTSSPFSRAKSSMPVETSIPARS